MNTNNAKNFRGNLLNIPDMPSSILPTVEHTIHKRKIIARGAWTLLIAGLLAAGSMTYSLRPYLFNSSKTTTEIADKGITEELQIAETFLNGVNLDDEMNMYAFVDPTLF